LERLARQQHSMRVSFLPFGREYRADYSCDPCLPLTSSPPLRIPIGEPRENRCRHEVSKLHEFKAVRGPSCLTTVRSPHGAAVCPERIGARLVGFSDNDDLTATLLPPESVAFRSPI